MRVLVTGFRPHLHLRNSRHFGLFTSPLNGQRADQLGIPYGCDNDVFSGRFDETRWSEFVNGLDPSNALFAAMPDVVGDWEWTLRSFYRFREMVNPNMPVAVVLQDGATVCSVPWGECAAVFIGGTDAFKLDPGAVAPLTREAIARNKWIHMGRVNSRKRMVYANSLGCDSVDGTFSRFDPPRVAKMIRWASELPAKGAFLRSMPPIQMEMF